MFRSRRFKKWAIVFGVLFFLFLAYRLPLYFAVQSRIAEIRKQGRPTTLEDIKAWSTALPAEENSADALVRTFERLNWDLESLSYPLQLLPASGGGGIQNYVIDPRLRSEIQVVVASNGRVIEQLRQISVGINFRWPWADEYEGQFQVPFADLRGAVVLLTFDAISASESGDCGRAASSIDLALKLSHANDPLLSPYGNMRGYLLEIVRFGVLAFLASDCAADPSASILHAALERETAPVDLVAGLDIERARLIYEIGSTPFSQRMGNEGIIGNLANVQIPALGWLLSAVARCTGVTDAMLLRLLDAFDEWRTAAEVYQSTGNNRALIEFSNSWLSDRSAVSFFPFTWVWAHLIDDESRRRIQAETLLSTLEEAAEHKEN